MFWRFFSFVLLQASGGVSAWILAPAPLRAISVPLAMFVGSLAWFVLDFSRAIRLLRWLRIGSTAENAVSTGWWGDVSDRIRRLLRAREQKIADSDHRLQDFLAALQASPNGVVLLDLQGRIEWFNQTAAGHFGLDAQRDKLQHFGNLVRDPGFAAYYAKADFADDLVMPGREHSIARPVRLSVHVHPYGEGRSLMLSRDITALEQAEAMRRDFVANVSHEIRTPLTVLSGFVETLQTLTLDDRERVRYLDLMAQQADRMQTLVSDLLTLSRLEGAPPPATTQWVPMPELMRRLHEEGAALSAVLTQSSGHAQSLTFVCLFHGDVAGALPELHSALSNLISNAVRYTPPGGTIQATAELLADGRCKFYVRDTGPGIAPEHIPRLTERFYRVDSSRSRDTGGTGLGLAIVKHVAQRHGAEFLIESMPGKGSVFTLIFPASRVRQATGTVAPGAVLL